MRLLLSFCYFIWAKDPPISQHYEDKSICIIRKYEVKLFKP